MSTPVTRTVLVTEQAGEVPRPVVIAVVVDPAQLPAARLHGDVVDALVDLVVAMIDEERA